MRGSPEAMKVLRPATPGEALRLYARRRGAVPLAGGTDLMVSWNMGRLNGRTILDLSRLAEWRRIRTTADGGLRIGALATHSDIQRHAVVARSYPLLARACSTVGAVQIQNRGTLGGNIANASPAGDTFPALAVYEASVELASGAGRRRIPFLEVFAGVKRTTLRPGELIEAVELPPPGGRPAAALFRKVGTRAAQAVSKTVIAGLLWLDAQGRSREVRVALGSVAPTVRRARAFEAALRGRRPGPRAVAAALGALERDICPIDDIRSTAAYRLEASRAILRRWLEVDHAP